MKLNAETKFRTVLREALLLIPRILVEPFGLSDKGILRRTHAEEQFDREQIAAINRRAIAGNRRR